MSKPIALHAYDVLAESLAVELGTKLENACYERPAMLSLLPDVNNKTVLDAGCGPGIYAEILCNKGASVIACDVSPRMVKLARQRLGRRALVIEADLDAKLEFAKNESFDLVLSALVLDHVRDIYFTFQEFQRILRPCSHLLFSVLHPFAEFQKHSKKGYFSTELVEVTWEMAGKSVKVLSFRRSLEAILSHLTRSGFLIEELHEPKPTEEFKQEDPKMFKELMHRPGILCVRAIKKAR